MGNMQELARLRKEYAALPDEQIIELAAQGKDDFTEGAYDLIMSEVENRGLRDRINQTADKSERIAESAGCECGGVAKPCDVAPQDEMLPILILLDEDDASRILPMLDEAGIEYCNDSIHLKGKEYPRILMISRGRLDEAIAKLSPFKLSRSIALW